jgi:restriction system protein
MENWMNIAEETTGIVQVGPVWEGRLEDWLALMSRHDPQAQAEFQYWSFPTSGLLEEYVASIESRSEDDVQHLLRCFVFSESTFKGDKTNLDVLVKGGDINLVDKVLATDYGKRLFSAGTTVHPGLSWILDLLPHWPRLALEVINAYIVVFGQFLPDGRFDGLSDAATLVSARYLHRRCVDGASALQGISPRELEQLAARLYTAMGYDCELTPRGRDGGRDIIATRNQIGRRERRLIECKHYAGSVKLRDVRALLGVVSLEHASSGVLVTTGKVTKGMRKLERLDNRLDLVDGSRLVALLDEYFGSEWPTRLDIHLQWPQRNAGT